LLYLKQIERFGLSFAGILRKEDIETNFSGGSVSDRILTLLTQYELNPGRLYRVKQEHSDNIYVIDNKEKTEQIPADGIITNIPGVTLCISIADCVPVFIFDAKAKILGVIHAGREGTRKRIVQKALEILTSKFKSNKKDIIALIGPSIGPCCYYLPDDLLNLCKKEGLIISERKTLDLWISNEKQFVDYGINKQNIFIFNECTFCNDDYYSYRRGDKKSRNYAVAMI